MLKKKNRLTTKEFQEVFEEGKKTHTPIFLFAKLQNKKEIKIGISVPKKIFKKAFKRNETKRIILNIIKENKILPINNFFVLVLKKPIQNKDAIKKELINYFKKN